MWCKPRKDVGVSPEKCGCKPLKDVGVSPETDPENEKLL